MLVTLTIDPEDGRWVGFLDDWLTDRSMVGWDRRDTVAGILAGLPEAQAREVTRASIRYVAASWNRLNVSMRRELPGLAYFRALELQGNGRAHLHVLLRGSSLADLLRARQVLRRLAVRSGFGGEEGRGMGFDADRLRSTRGAAYYVGKVVKGRAGGYVAKAEGPRLPKYARRFAWSRQWCEWQRPEPLPGFYGWRIARASTQTVERALLASGINAVPAGMFRSVSAGERPAGEG